MAQSDLPSDPLAAHDVLLQRAERLYSVRREERRKPLPEQSQAEVRLVRGSRIELLSAEILDVSHSGMRLAGFVNQTVQQGDRCEIRVLTSAATTASVWATVLWVKPHPLIQVFGVEFDERQP
jgi:hypothetical protein